MFSKKEKNAVSELRLDLVSDDWVIVATGRARRPDTFAKLKRIKEEVSPKDCPFCQPEILDKAILGRGNVISMPNDFPALSYGNSLNKRFEGPNGIMDGIGFHEIIIFLNHEKQLAQFSSEEIKEVIDVYQARYLDLIKKEFIKYVSIFHNHGKEAGASVVHPHSQLIAVPVLDPHLKKSIRGAESFYKKNNKCVYCVMIEWDKKDGQRIVYENEKFVVLCPFAPQSDFEIRIYPKEHSPYFEKITEEDKKFFADALKVVLSKIYKGLNDPAYNFYIHTAPRKDQNQEHYHWHLVILPKTSIYAGFELSVGMEISTVEPEKAAEFLRNI
ncbi:MAG: galactose-1-phosphate uridylyltransferase [Candidatus Parcubacteria bacterium]|nr:galactose-1-phosphate uridylyltransferase [Candidatus Parcubacteria bacterium]